jgi:MSHA pilin protein MshD
MSIRQCSARAFQRGVTLVELIMFIVIVSVGLAGVLIVLNVTVMHSADPMINKQLLAIAEAYLEEVSSMPFTYCDQDDPNVASATSWVVGAGGCATWPEGPGLGPETQGGTTETRNGATVPFDNVNDYSGYAQATATDASLTHSYPGYSVSVAVANDANLGPGGSPLPSAAVLRVAVTVTSGSNSLTLEGYRTRYAPNAQQ